MRSAVSNARIDCDTHRAYDAGMEQIAHIWPSPKALADDLGLPYTTVHSWFARERFPASRDLDLIAAAKRRGCALSLEDLAKARRAKTSEGAR